MKRIDGTIERARMIEPLGGGKPNPIIIGTLTDRSRRTAPVWASVNHGPLSMIAEFIHNGQLDAAAHLPTRS